MLAGTQLVGSLVFSLKYFGGLGGRERRDGSILIISCSTYCKHCSSLRSMPFLKHCRLLLRKIVKFVLGSGLDNGLYILVKKKGLRSNYRLISLPTNCVFVTKFIQNTTRNNISNAFVLIFQRTVTQRTIALRDEIAVLFNVFNCLVEPQLKIRYLFF